LTKPLERERKGKEGRNESKREGKQSGCERRAKCLLVKSRAFPPKEVQASQKMLESIFESHLQRRRRVTGQMETGSQP
jgi:hypothetical protein